MPVRSRRLLHKPHDRRIPSHIPSRAGPDQAIQMGPNEEAVIATRHSCSDRSDQSDSASPGASFSETFPAGDSMVLVWIGFRTSRLCAATVGSHYYRGEDRLPDSPKYVRITRCTG